MNIGSRGNKQTIFSEQKNVGRMRVKVVVAISSAKEVNYPTAFSFSMKWLNYQQTFTYIYVKLFYSNGKKIDTKI